MEIQSLTISERITLAKALWDSVVAEGSEIELTEAQQTELDRRLAAFEIDHEAGSPWSSVKARILKNGVSKTETKTRSATLN